MGHKVHAYARLGMRRCAYLSIPPHSRLHSLDLPADGFVSGRQPGCGVQIPQRLVCVAQATVRLPPPEQRLHIALVLLKHLHFSLKTPLWRHMPYVACVYVSCMICAFSAQATYTHTHVPNQACTASSRWLYPARAPLLFLDEVQGGQSGADLAAVPLSALPVFQLELTCSHVEVDRLLYSGCLDCMRPMQLDHEVIIDVRQRHGVLPQSIRVLALHVAASSQGRQLSATHLRPHPC